MRQTEDAMGRIHTMIKEWKGLTLKEKSKKKGVEKDYLQIKGGAPKGFN